jgi:hypothetical protein
MDFRSCSSWFSREKRIAVRTFVTSAELPGVLCVLNTSNVIVIQIGVEVTMSKSDAAG